MTTSPEGHRIGAAALRHPSVFVATLGGVGLLRPAPGTWGSLAALLPAWWLLQVWPSGLWLLGFGLLLPGIPVAAAAGRHLGAHDHGGIVIDEVAGQWLAIAVPSLLLSTAVPMPLLLALCFAGFRLFDIFKPWPVSALDRLHGGVGVMLDDVAAGLMAGLVVTPVLLLA